MHELGACRCCEAAIHWYFTSAYPTYTYIHKHTHRERERRAGHVPLWEGCQPLLTKDAGQFKVLCKTVSVWFETKSSLNAQISFDIQHQCQNWLQTSIM